MKPKTMLLSEYIKRLQAANISEDIIDSEIYQIIENKQPAVFTDTLCVETCRDEIPMKE